MSVNATQTHTISKMMYAALSGKLPDAIAVLNQTGLTEGQKAKIEAILKEPRSTMQQSIVAILAEKNIIPIAPSSDQAVSSQALLEQRDVSFADATTSPFENAYPCSIEFGGKQYQNATACLLAQQCTGQPEIMDLFSTLSHEDAIALAEFNALTKESNRPRSRFPTAAISLPSKRQRSCDNADEERIAKKCKTSCENPQAKLNKDDLLMQVLRAKFDQNPDLKKQLLATGDAHLVCQDHGLNLCDIMDGTGENALATSLMRLRDEYRSTGQVEPRAADQSTMQSLVATSSSNANKLYPDVMELLLNRYLSECDFTTVTAVACLNKHWNNSSTKFWEKQDLKQLCPELTILDAKAQEVQCEDEPKISKLRLIKWVKEISPHVEENAGVTLLTMIKGTTLNQLIEIAKGDGMDVNDGDDEIIKNLGDAAIVQTYGILITNDVFMNSRDKAYNLQEIIEEGHGCVMPTVHEYVALCVYTNKVFKKCLYGDTPWTYGRSSTCTIEDGIQFAVMVGASSTHDLYVMKNNVDNTAYGAGGRRKF